MRIEDKISLNYDKLVDGKKKSEKTGKSSESTKKDDQVSISSKGKDILNLTTAVKDAPEIRTEQIGKIKQDIESGDYNVEGKKVAEKIINNAIDGLF
jgi:negative regulator of flagellin synthesis FlgM